MMLGEKVTAEEAERMGMIYKYFSCNDTFEEEAGKIALTLASMPTKGLAYTKQLLDNSFEHTYEEQLQQEEIFQQRAGGTKDYKEGVEAFLQKRKPNFHRRMSTQSKKRSGKRGDNMMQHDQFSRWLGIRVLAVKEGYAKSR
jgi:1,4-dihydroxy-2-naphthoyl-CoA synthase